MKTLRLSIAALVLAAALPAFAETTTPPPSSTATTDRPQLRQHAQRRGADRARLARRLGLTAEQKQQLKAKRAERAASAKAIREDASLSPEQKKTKLREAWKAAQTDLRSVLTAEQQSKLDRLQKRARRMAHLRASL